jgi:hypothetical protein
MKNLVRLMLAAGWMLLITGCTKSESDSDNQNLGLTGDFRISLSNQSGTYPDDSIFFSVMGSDEKGNVCWIDSTGNLVQVKKADNTYNGYCNYFHPLSKMKSISFSYLNGARIRFSIGKPIRMKITSENPNAGFTDPDFNNPGDANSTLIYDKIEFSYVNKILYLNTTLVDYFGIPLAVSSVVNGDTVVVGMNASRKDIFDKFTTTAPADFKTLVQGNYRIVAPQKLLAFNQSYFDSYIDSVWAKYRTDSLIITGNSPANWRAAGKVTGNVFQFKFTSSQFHNETVSIAKPTTKNVFGCDGEGSLKTDANHPLSHQKLIPKVAGALNRSVLYGYDYQNGCDTSTFYKHGTTNWFSKIFHQCSISNKCYGFPFDDDCDQSSLYPGGNVSELSITVTKF